MSDTGADSDHTTDPVFAGRFSDAPIGAVRAPTGVRWLLMLVIFMRLAAVFWLLRGLLQWTYIIGIGDPTFPELRLSRQGLVMLLAVLDIVAAVGLWLTASWGVAIWLVVLFIEAALPYLVPDMQFALADVLVSAGAGVVYLFFVWQAAREQRASER